MKKKIINGFLVMALLVASVGSFVSCKDYEEDNYSELLGKNASLEQTVKALKKELQDQIAALKIAQDECKSTCASKFAQLEKAMNEGDASLLEKINNEVAALKAIDAKLEARIASAEAKLVDLEANQKDLQKQIDDLKKAQQDCKTACDAKLVALETAMKAGDAELQKKINDEIAILKDQNAKYEIRLASLESTLKTMQSEINGNTAKIADLTTELEKVKATAEAANTLATANGVKISKLETTVADINKAVEELQTWTNKWQTTLEDVAGMKAQTDLNAARLDSLISNLNLCSGCTDAVNARVDSLVNVYNAYLIENNKALTELREDCDSLYKKAIGYVDQQVALINDKLGVINTTINDLKAAYEAADKQLQGQIDAIKADVEALEARVAANEQAIANLTGALKKMITGIIIQGTNNPLFGSFALPVNLQSNILAAYYGYASSQGVAFPTLKPRYYVDPDDVILTEQDFEMLGVSEKKLVESGAVILGDEGNAGKVYLTINPNTVDFTGVELPLVNSLDENSGVMLSGLEKSNHKLSFGYNTRANNGFYEAKASIDPAAIEDVKLKINFGELKEVAKDIVNGNGINVSNVAKTVANQLSAFEMDANGVKASWTDAYGEHSVYSQYAIAATAIKPLSMSFGKDFNFKKVPGVDKAERFIGRISDKVFNKINSAIPDFSGLNFVAPQIKKIEIPSLNPDSFKITIDIATTVEYKFETTVDVEDVVINDMNGTTQTITVTVPEKNHKVHVKKWIYGYEADGVTKKDSTLVDEEEEILIPEYTIEVPSTNFTVKGQVVEIKDVLVKKDLVIPVSFTHVEDIYPIINSLYSDIVGPIEDVNVMLEDLEAFMDDVNKMLDELNKIKDITNTFDHLNDNIKDQVAKYLDKFNNKFCNLINSTNKALRPVMLIKTVDGFSKISQAYNAPTRISGTEATLIATSYTAEVLAPSYKKLVGVTNVIKNGTSAKAGDADCKSVLDAVNAGDLATVVDGGQMKFYANFKKGYTYELVYTTVDFHGLVDAKKFYVVCE